MDRRLTGLSQAVLDRLGAELTEVDATVLRHPETGRALGLRRTAEHPELDRVVSLELADPWRGLDSWMLHAFTPPGSAVPHLAVEAVKASDGYTVFADLLPRVDLVTHPEQVLSVFSPLNATYAAGMSAGVALPLSPAHRSLLSPWCFAVVTSSVGCWRTAMGAALGYLEHWQSVLAAGAPSSLSRAALAARDRVHRRSLVDPALDPMWGVAEGLVGRPAVTELRSLLSGE